MLTHPLCRVLQTHADSHDGRRKYCIDDEGRCKTPPPHPSSKGSPPPFGLRKCSGTRSGSASSSILTDTGSAWRRTVPRSTAFRWTTRGYPASRLSDRGVFPQVAPSWIGLRGMRLGGTETTPLASARRRRWSMRSSDGAIDPYVPSALSPPRCEAVVASRPLREDHHGRIRSWILPDYRTSLVRV